MKALGSEQINAVRQFGLVGEEGMRQACRKGFNKKSDRISGSPFKRMKVAFSEALQAWHLHRQSSAGFNAWRFKNPVC